MRANHSKVEHSTQQTPASGDTNAVQASGQPDLTEEALRPERGGELGVKYLERHWPVVLEIVREMDRGHAAAPEHTLERVSVG